jgi:DHA1 family bicyclomycin/chloramphenicol resistance-like MFS transporter
LNLSAAAQNATNAPMGKREFIVLISMLMALTALAIDMMLPALAQMREGFGLPADSSSLALVVTVFLLGFGLGQPFWGPLSDALGRKRVLWLGLAVYVIAALGAAFAPSLAALLALRFVAGFGSAAIRVVTQGTVRDQYQGDQMAKVLSYIMAVFLLVPMVAPSIGTAILAVADWRWIFAVFVIAAVIAGLWATRLQETLPPERRIPLEPARLVAAAGAVLSSRFSMGLSLAQMFAFGFFISYLASSELIIGDIFGLAAWFPLIFGATALLAGATMLLNPRLIDRFGLRRMVRFSVVTYATATVAFAAVALVTGGTPPFWLYMAMLLPILLAHSFAMPNLNSAAMMPMGRVAGTAAALIGSITILGGSLLGAFIDAAYDNTLVPFALAGLLLAMLSLAFYRWADGVWEHDGTRQVEPDAGRDPAIPLPNEAG